MKDSSKIVLSGLFLALGIIMPIFFHFITLSGAIFLPMHIPVLIAGLILGRKYGIIVGSLTPLISSLLTGMPPLVPIPIAIIMAFELAVYGGVIGYLHHDRKLNTFISLIIAQISGRVTVGLVVAVLVSLFGFNKLNPISYVAGSMITGIPGIMTQLIVIPSLFYVLFKVRKGGISLG